MTEKDFLEKLADVLNVKSVLTMDMKLDRIDRLDSLGAMAFMGMCFNISSKSIANEKVRATKTVRDLYELL